MITKDNIFFSFDDGHPNDLIIAQKLQQFWFKNAIFYIPIKNIEWKEVMNENQILNLSKIYEIWWHTYNHIDLTTIDDTNVLNEITKGKEWIENIISKKITSFCFPRWHYNNTIIELVRKAWFKNARSARLYNFNKLNKRAFLFHPNIHFYSHSILIDILHCIKNMDIYSLYQRLKYIALSHNDLIWKILKKNKEIHIWWHSREIDIKEFDIFLVNLIHKIDTWVL